MQATKGWTFQKILVTAAVVAVLMTSLGYRPAASDQQQAFEATTVVDGLEHPWGMAFLPDGRILITERPGRLRVVSDGRLDPQTVTGLPPIAAGGQGGLMDVALHPAFSENALVYLSYSAEMSGGRGTQVIRGRLDGHDLVDVETIFRAEPGFGGGRHFGSRLLFDDNGYLYISLGDRGDRPNGQKLDTHPGSIIRLHDDGSIPEDNPFVGRSDARPEIFTYGNRNVQGLTLEPGSNRIWAHEHGPQGGDELNIVSPGANYGWPVITYGRNYVTGTKIGDGTEMTGVEPPVHYWVPSIAPSGLAFYEGDKFPGWQGNLLVGSLKYQLLVRLELDDARVTREHRLLQGELGRIRDVRIGPDGYVYLLTDEPDGELIRLAPSSA